MRYKIFAVGALLIGGAVIWSAINCQSKAQTDADEKQPAVGKRASGSSAKPADGMGGGGFRPGAQAANRVAKRPVHKRGEHSPEIWTGATWISTQSARQRAFERRARQALQQPITIQCEDQPLADVAKMLAEKSGLNILFDLKALEEPSITPSDATVSLDVSQVSTEAALKRILSLIDDSLTWTLQDEALLITTRTKAEAQENFEVRIYPVHDLVATDGDAAPDFDSLIDMITSTIAPDTWGDAPGQGSIKSFDNPETLVVAHTGSVQQQIASLLKGLRIARAMQDGNDKVLTSLKQDDVAPEAKEGAKVIAPVRPEKAQP